MNQITAAVGFGPDSISTCGKELGINRIYGSAWLRMDTFFFDYLRGRGLGWIGFYVQHHSLSRKMNQIPPLIEYLFLFHT